MQPSPQHPAGLPEPDEASRRHSDRMIAHLRCVISDAGGSIGFGEYMQHALYAPGLGYYVAGSRKFGADGDFVTAPEVSPLFGQVLARQMAPLIREQGCADVLELGPGAGTLAVHLLRKLAELDAMPARYRLLEISPDLQERQRQRIAAEVPEHAGRVQWEAGLPAHFRGVVIANEVADALPVERFVRTADGVLQVSVADDGKGLRLQRRPAPGWLHDAVIALEQGLGRRLPEGYESELSPGLGGWLDSIAGAVEHGFVFLFDYGLARHEYYAADRHGGWLRCHFRHRAHDDVLFHPGIQDLTAWVDFTAVAEAAVAGGMEVAGYVSQARFLLDGGLPEELLAAAGQDERAQLDLSRQVKLLTLPGEMGEHFKCIGLRAGAVPTPGAFRMADRAHAL